MLSLLTVKGLELSELEKKSKKQGVPYQKMIKSVLDHYATEYS
jgi:predicted DNA binding CopG/RHH family protein